MTTLVNRPTRTGIQATISLIFVEFVDAFFFDMDERQYGALVAVLTVVISLVIVLVEHATGVKILRKEEDAQ